MEKVWEVKDPDQYFQSRKKKRASAPVDEKNPAKAYTLSLVFWGVGQNYNDQRGKGLLFQLFMIGFCLATVLSLVFGNILLQFLRSQEIPVSHSFIFAELLFFCVLVFWMFVAGDAYHTAAKTRTTRFLGIQSHVYPLLCSLLLPGWGQFLNGQPIKGSIFSGLSVLGLFSFVSIPVSLLVWPRLDASGARFIVDASDARFIIEAIFAITVLYAPLIPFIWLFSGYDALKISLDDLKKESFFERLKATNNRRRAQGWVSGVFPHFKSTIILGLFLVLLLIVIQRFFPANYYFDLLAFAQTRLIEQGMTIVPDLIDKLLSLTQMVK